MPLASPSGCSPQAGRWRTPTASPNATAFAGGTIQAANLTVEASDSEASGQYAAEANATGSRAALSRSTGRRPTAKNSGNVTSYVSNNATLSIGSAINVTATNDTDQWANANGHAYGLVAAGRQRGGRRRATSRPLPTWARASTSPPGRHRRPDERRHILRCPRQHMLFQPLDGHQRKRNIPRDGHRAGDGRPKSSIRTVEIRRSAD